METESLIQEFPDKADRRNHILKNQLYGISPDQMCQLMSTRTVYGTINGQSKIISFGDNYLGVMQNTDKTAVEIEWCLETPVREDIYEYIVG